MKRFFFCAISIVASDYALACKCEKLSLAEQFTRAPIVFVGAADSDFHPGSSGQTANFLVSRALKGEVIAGSPFIVDPMFETDCAAYIMPGVQLLVFAYPQPTGAPVVTACSTRLAGSVPTGEGVALPSAEVVDFLRSLSK